MRELSKQQIEEKFGKFGFLGGTGKELLIAKVYYMTGIPTFDKRLNEKPFNKRANTIYFEKRPQGFEICLNVRFTGYCARSMPHSFERKEWSAARRALCTRFIALFR